MMAIKIGPLLLLTVVQAATRYHPDPSTDEKFAEDIGSVGFREVTPLGSMPAQSGFYWWNSASHGFVSIPLAAIMLTQWIRTRGDSIHINLGKIVKWTFLAFFLQGWVLNIRHSFLTPEKAFKEYPGIFDMKTARPLVSCFGFSLCSCSGQAFWIGIRDKTRRVGLHTPAFYFIKGASWMTFVCGIWFYVFAIGRMSEYPVSHYKWEINFEMMLLLPVLFIFDGTALWAMAGWEKTGELLDWKEHHHMMAAWVSSISLFAILLFFVHDARHVWTYPGIQSMWVRLAIQLTPQFVLFAFTVPRIVRYVLKCGPNQEKSTMLNEMAEKS